MATNDFSPPIASPPDRPPANVSQVDIHAVNQPWGAIPDVMGKIDGGDAKLLPISGRSDKGTGRGRRGS